MAKQFKKRWKKNMFSSLFTGTSTSQRLAEPSVECNGANKNLREGKATYIIYKLSDDGASIQVDVEGKASYDFFLQDLPSNECRWAEYGIDVYGGEQRPTAMLFFFTWTPSGASVQSKANYSANTDVVKGTWKRIDVAIKCSTLDEIEFRNLF